MHGDRTLHVVETPGHTRGHVRWTRRGHKLVDLDLLNRMLAVTETAAHLELLLAQGRLTRADVDGLRCYAIA
ncbi:hypothetical protein Vqi01_45350 [Micromonospora qiuiae]|uniref:Uncharacterized protein n=1 Tax=Micromonospora qiuiae TaxID=502268 RepID=A0ABQ4JG21_9ACTN|nr:hypothetical protein Vqi01_45350 [Micromonospora qiuiae]